ncbi:glutamine--fructose-6-phosphate aminotransferase [isomerizing]-like [Hylaeus volcanicus]|uniref:glutamine--fructose-6-phosphate aminotransferase [isomerizing]-like n=1 Tax=Hylaeus volcanicus TaxID=313075 RepID=UPI0023B84586|nr:glutamine--fructose-6-phosphate aminotransferase [isomerizing]-like [Hylaeus volcanicus]
MSLFKISSFITACGAYGLYNTHKKHHGHTTMAKCCGIVGYIGSKNAQEVLLNGLKILQNRGYDSCGLSTLSESNELCTAKFASCGTTSDCIDILSRHLKDNPANHHMGIAHTRWATHGAKTNTNAHPHTDYKNRLSLVHNGTIINYQSIKKDLVAKGIPFKSDTDSEVIVNLISYLLDETKNVLQATSKALELLQGTWGLAIISKECDQEIILARNGSPLIVGCCQNEVFVASEPSALAMYTNQFVELDDGEICVAKIDGIQNLAAQKDLFDVPIDNFSLSPSPYDHWTLKEIMEQPETVERALNFGGRLHPVGYSVKLGGLEQSVTVISKIQNLIITGCGTSFYAGMCGELLMHHLGCFETIQTLDAAEVTSERFPRTSSSGVLLLSQSGETHDTIRVFRMAANLSVPCFSVVNGVGSQLARLTKCGVYLNAGREVAVASTKVFLSQVIVLSLIAVWWAQRHNISSEKCQTMMRSLCRLPLSIKVLLKDHRPFKILADTLKHCQNIFVLGKNVGYPIALEGALKIKEISYIHAEGFSLASLKHGPLALIDGHAKSPVILICTGESEMSFLESTAEQLKARRAYVIVIIEVDKVLNTNVDTHLFVPSNDIFSPLLAVVCLQTLAYYLAISRGINPDKPRSLAKTVTVS